MKRGDNESLNVIRINLYILKNRVCFKNMVEDYERIGRCLELLQHTNGGVQVLKLQKSQWGKKMPSCRHLDV